MTIEIGFAIPEPLSRISGGYFYDHALLAWLETGPVRLTPLPLPEGFPAPTPEALRETEVRLDAWPGPLLIDGLAFGAFPKALAEKVGPRAVALVHHPLGYEAGLSPERRAALLASERAALAAARGAICTSDDTARRLTSDFGLAREAICVAPPGVALPPAPAPRQGKPPLLLAVGSLTRRKNFDGMIRALGGVADLPWRARIVGPRGLELAAEEAVARALKDTGLGDRVAITGPRADIASEYQGADMFLSTALYEGYGMALAEAMAHGLPVLTVAGGAAGDTAATAALVDLDPEESLTQRFSERLRALLTDADARDALAADAWAAACSLPDWAETSRRARAFLADAFGAEIA